MAKTSGAVLRWDLERHRRSAAAHQRREDRQPLTVRTPTASTRSPTTILASAAAGPSTAISAALFGVGPEEQRQARLTFLALNYEEGDEIYLFGFSRGAYTARAVAGVIGAAGIPFDISNLEMHWDKYQQIAKLRPITGGRNSPKRLKAEAAIES